MKEIKLLLADDQDLIRESLNIVLDMDPDIEVVALAENGEAAVAACRDKQPNVVLMDIHMPVMDGVEATKRIKAQWPETRVIILTTFQEVGYVVEALGAGAEGYLLKAIHPKDLVAGIKWVHRGGTLIPQDIARLLVDQVRTGGADASGGARFGGAASGGHGGIGNAGGTGIGGNAGHGGAGENGGVGYGAAGGVPGGHGGTGNAGGAAGVGYGGSGGFGSNAGGSRGGAGSGASAAASVYGLSERELQVLHSIADGLNNKEIAEKLFLSEGTVKNYISNIYSKMDVRDRIQAARKAQDEGML
jgi:DNA-binding NarL/FixJ family response regulator